MKALIIASVASMIDQFNMPNIKLLQKLGYEVNVACNFIEGNTCNEEKIHSIKNNLTLLGVRFYQIDFARKVASVSQNIKAYKQVKALLWENCYHLIHCHSPIGGFLTRLAAKNIKNKETKVIYTAHGFHFFKGAPLKNWLLYYPVEKLCAKWTDVLITINTEDYALAQKKLSAKKVEYVPGVGVDLKKFSSDAVSQEDRNKIRASLGVGVDDKLLLSVGELNGNKNHELVIRSLAELHNPNIHYAVAGKGELYEYLLCLAKELGVECQVHLLGFRSDVAGLYSAADLYVHPSKREGLPVALMEAIASKIPVVCSNIRGNTDLVGGKALFSCKDINDAAEKIKSYISGDHATEICKNYENLKKYGIDSVSLCMEKLYMEHGL